MYEPTRSDLDQIAARYGHPPRWVSQMVESGFLPKPEPRGRGRARSVDWVYPLGTDSKLRALCRLHKMGYHRGALRFAWWYIGCGQWAAEAANYVAEVVTLTKKMHARRVGALATDPDGQNAIAENLLDETQGDFTRADYVNHIAKLVAPGNTPSDRLRRVIIAREFGLLPNAVREDYRRLLAALAEDQAETFGESADEHDLVEYAKKLNATGGASSPIPPGFVAQDPIAHARRALFARLGRGRLGPFESPFDPDKLTNYLERSSMQRQYLVNDAVLNRCLVRDAEVYIWNADANVAGIVRHQSRRPERQRQRRRRVKEVAAWLAQFSERDRHRQGVPAPGPALAERAKDVAGGILATQVLRDNGYTG